MAKFTDRIDRRFPYTPAADSAKPNYLKDKFDRIRRELREKAAADEAAEAERAEKVRKIKGAT